MRARMSSMLLTPLASPNSSQASKTSIGAESLNKPHGGLGTRLILTAWVGPGDTGIGWGLFIWRISVMRSGPRAAGDAGRSEAAVGDAVGDLSPLADDAAT